MYFEINNKLTSDYMNPVYFGTNRQIQAYVDCAHPTSTLSR
ncbi:hypothetical protein Cal7507_3919 [Calothrix sp. PCC 7507]|nr:hypothetical protein Cal7507_3919 [Calothrix sp. PCC 7507]